MPPYATHVAQPPVRHKLSLVARRQKRNVAGELFFYILLCKWLPTMQRLGELVQQDLAPVAAVHKASGQTHHHLLVWVILGGSSTRFGGLLKMESAFGEWLL